MPWVPGLTLHILTHERARVGRRSLVDALADLARTHTLAGMSVLRGVEGISGHSHLRTTAVLELSDDLPLVIEIVDRAERLEPLLGEIAALCPNEVLSVTESRVYFSASRLAVRDVMAPPRAVATTTMPLAEALSLLVEGGIRLLPVVDAARTLVGVLTLGHLLRAADPDLTEHLLAGDAAHLRTHLEREMAGQSVGQHMVAPFLLPHDASLEAAARMLIAHHLTRAPVVDDSRVLVGVVSERALVSALIAPVLGAAEGIHDGAGPGNGEIGEALRRSILPGAGMPLTAGALADSSAPCLSEHASLADVAEAMRRAREGVVCVVDGAGRARGIINEQAALAHLVPGAHAGQALLSHLFSRHPARVFAILGQHEDHPLSAASLLLATVPQVAEGTPIAEAIARMLDVSPSNLALVVDANRKPIGVLWREDALRALIGG